MILVEIYSRPDCHLCDIAKDVITKIQQQHPFTFNVITINEGDAKYDEYHERVPVVCINNEFAFQYKVVAKEFMKKLNALAEAER